MCRLLLITCLLASVFGLTACQSTGLKVRDAYNLENPVVKPGIEVLLSNPSYLALLKGKNVGLITNPTGVDSKLRSTVDLLHEHPEINLVRLFAPEHGVRGDAYAGEKVARDVDARTGIPVYSLYGENRRPPQSYLDGLDIMVYDIQDVGSRSYTYIYTMSYAMEECAKRRIPFMVLDRPNPCGPVVSGNVLDPSFYSGMVGRFPIAYQYGMTPGEIAAMFNAEFHGEDKVELFVVPMEGYNRNMMYWDTGLPWILPSPHIPTARHATYYNLIGIIGELRHVSIGVGYTLPFETVAAPWMKGEEMAEALRAKNIPGLMVRPITYKPFGLRFNGEVCKGVQLIVSNYRTLQPVEAQIHIMEVIHRLHPEERPFSDERCITDERGQRILFDQVLGTADIRRAIDAGATAEEVIASYQADLARFMERRKPYLNPLYN
jgi:uncharacterized protein YbbC (DUF1343 family)